MEKLIMLMEAHTMDNGRMGRNQETEPRSRKVAQYLLDNLKMMWRKGLELPFRQQEKYQNRVSKETTYFDKLGRLYIFCLRNYLKFKVGLQ